MKQYIKNLDNNVNGKKLLILIHRALKSEQVINEVIFEYLNKLKNNNVDIRDYALKMSPFDYSGKLQRIMKVQDLLKYNARNIYRGYGEDSLSEFHKQTEADIEDYLDIVEFNYDTLIDSWHGLFIWITPVQTNTNDLSYRLGLEFPNEHLMSIVFPEVEYSLHYPTLIEADKYRWFSANDNKLDKWGKTLNILNIHDYCTENSLVGLDEALSKPLKLEEKCEIDYIGQTKNDRNYFDDQYDILLKKIDISFFKNRIIDDIIAIYEEQI